MKAAGLRSMASSTQISDSSLPTPRTSVDLTKVEELSKSDLWIFCEGRWQVSGPAFVRELQQALATNQALLDSLIHAGELEAVLADAGAHDAPIAAAITDVLAREMCTGDRGADDPEQLTKRIDVPATISISPPEGFTYYALHPLDFARAAEQIAPTAERFAVIGIRSIGTTLSAVTTAALIATAKAAERITVRPTGHPYSRSTKFSSSDERWISEQNMRAAHFLIVDEGPGRSGSTFLSVAEALAASGISRKRITIVGSRSFDLESLCAQGAVERWKQFRYVVTTPSFSNRFEDWRYLGNGDWRMYFCSSEQEWPETWTQMERFKVLSPDRREFVKFEGMGRIGKEVRQRAIALAEAGFSPPSSDFGDGFVSYAAVQGKHLRKSDLTLDVLEQIARYCAFRVAEFRCREGHSSELEKMLVYNVQQEFGYELKVDQGQLSPQEHAVLVDGRMQPYEWIACEDGRILKTDAISHGDNHFFPGPAGIGWDLAGVTVEWDLRAEETEFLLRRFRQYSGIDAAEDFELHMLAYCIFRLGFCKMARSTVLGSAEEKRLDSAYRKYRAKAEELLAMSLVA